MYWHLTPYTLPFLISALVSISLGVYIWTNRQVHPGTTTFSLLNLALGEWSLALALQSLSTDLDTALLWNNTALFGFVALPGLWYVTMTRFVRPDFSLKKRHIALMVGFPIALILLMLTDNSHHLFRVSAILEPSGEFKVLRVQYGPAFWVFMAYLYILVFAPCIPLLQYTRQRARWHQPKITILVILSMLPWIGSINSLLSPYHYPSVDLTPVILTMIGLTLAWSVPYFRLLHVIPFARDTIIDRMDDGIIVLDTELRLIDINPSAARLLGTSKVEALGRDGEEILGPLHTSLHLLLHESPLRIEKVTSDRFPETYWYELRANMLTDDRDRTEGWLLTIHDVSDREHTQKVLEEATASANAAVRIKDTFMANMSHELRTPLNSIIGYTTLMSQGTYGDLTEAQADRLSRILDSSKQLMEILNNILDLSRIEAEGLDIKRQPVALTPLLSECAAAIRPLANQKGLTISINLGADAMQVDADYQRLRQAVVNLLSNALKFTEEGEIVVRAAPAETRQLARIPAGSRRTISDWIVIEIHDTGIGIAAEDMEIIFDDFRQLDGSSTKSYPGAGLGLSIARRLVDLMGGSIWAESQPGVGSSFFIMLPRSETQADSLPTDNGSIAQK